MTKYFLKQTKKIFVSLKKMDKVVELVGGGSVINGAYPVGGWLNNELDTVQNTALEYQQTSLTYKKKKSLSTGNIYKI